jgi:hypothetical protein
MSSEASLNAPSRVLDIPCGTGRHSPELARRGHSVTPRESRLDIDYTFIRGAQVETRPSRSYVLTVNEICRLHEDAGLKLVELLGSVAGEPRQMGSPRLILISESPSA